MRVYAEQISLQSNLLSCIMCMIFQCMSTLHIKQSQSVRYRLGTLISSLPWDGSFMWWHFSVTSISVWLVFLSFVVGWPYWCMVWFFVQHWSWFTIILGVTLIFVWGCSWFGIVFSMIGLDLCSALLRCFLYSLLWWIQNNSQLQFIYTLL